MTPTRVPLSSGREPGGSKRMRRARYLAGDDASFETSSAQQCLCGPAIPTQKCAPAWHAGMSTQDCMDPQALLFARWRSLSRQKEEPDTLQPPLRWRQRWRRRSEKDARLRRRDKRDSLRLCPAVDFSVFSAPFTQAAVLAHSLARCVTACSESKILTSPLRAHVW